MTHSKQTRQISQSAFYIPSLIFLFFLGFYLFTAKGVIHIADGMVNFQTTRAIVENRSLAINCDILEAFVVKSPNGRCYSKYDTGLPLTAVPLYMLGRTLGGPDPADMYTVSAAKLWGSLLGQIATAATCAVLYSLCFHISKNELQAFSAAFLYGIATLAWPYAGLFFSQTLIAFLLTLAVTLLVIFPPNHTSAYVGAGLALGWACLTRLDTLPLIIVVTVYAFYRWKQAGGNGRSAEFKSGDTRRDWETAVVLLAGALCRTRCLRGTGTHHPRNVGTSAGAGQKPGRGCAAA